MINYAALIVALALSVVAGYYSIIGLTAIFSGAFWSILVMGTILEAAKVVTVSWLYRNWNTVPKLIKYYLSTAVVILMLITSMGIFGFLSKAHIETTTNAGVSVEQIAILDQKIATERQRIDSSQTVLKQLDASVQTLLDSQRVRGPNGAIALRESQKQERDNLTATIDEATQKLSALTEERTVYTQEQRKIEVEVGPLKYIAELIYGDQADTSMIERAVRYVIFVIIFVFDPLAILLLISANIGLSQPKVIRRGRPPKKKKSLTNVLKDSIIQLDKKSIMKME